MRNRLKVVSLTSAGLLFASGMTAVTMGSAAASDTSVARKCTVSAPRFTSSPGTSSKDPAFWPARGTYAKTTTRCADINVKLDKTRNVRTCFKKTGCSRYRKLTAGKWGLAAENVKDNVPFYLQFEGTSKATGLIDY
ncbi:hypothetical protein [Streptomyces varsoviensis]|nr:hypothetical protein [Streptomyces varsoviensis]